MKSTYLLLFGITCFGMALQGQAPPAPKPAASASVMERVPEGTAVVAMVDGQPVTYSELQSFLGAMPAQSRAAATKDPESFLRQFALMHRLSKEAEDRHLDRQSPYKEQLAYQRAMLLSTAGLNVLSQEVRVESGEAEAYYEAHKSDFVEVATKVIYLPFSNALPKAGETRTVMSESEALTLAQKLVSELRSGSDFVAAVKQYSKDEASAARNGDFATLKKTDNIPADVKAVVFQLKPGQISDPVRQPNGFYIFRAESVTEPEYLGVAARINTHLHDEKFRKKMDAMRDAIQIKDIRAELIK
ncbi:MAG: peptidylprolyl isomerase [Bryobacterales bacterium]|nr:peptidylprolyl isomerase [Bryobacterales bacterium]